MKCFPIPSFSFSHSLLFNPFPLIAVNKLHNNSQHTNIYGLLESLWHFRKYKSSSSLKLNFHWKGLENYQNHWFYIVLVFAFTDISVHPLYLSQNVNFTSPLWLEQWLEAASSHRKGLVNHQYHWFFIVFVFALWIMYFHPLYLF